MSRKKLTDKALDCKCEINGDGTTVRVYLLSLLEALWLEGESFSAKQPFGNSSWEYELYDGLVKGGLIKCKIDENGLSDFDENEANKLIHTAIKALK